MILNGLMSKTADRLDENKASIISLFLLKEKRWTMRSVIFPQVANKERDTQVLNIALPNVLHRNAAALTRQARE